MAIEATSLEYWQDLEADVKTSRTATSARATSWDVRETLRSIFGHDVLSDAEMMEGYRDQGAFDVEIAESNLAAAFEILPPE